MSDHYELPNQTIFIPVGLPCAGKSTFFRELIDLPGVGDNVALVSPDDIRDELYPGYSTGLVPFCDIDNPEVFSKANDRMDGHLLDGWDVWFDAVNTSLLARDMIRYEAEATRSSPEFTGGDLHYIIVDLDVPFTEIISRNESRRAGHRRPPIETLELMRRQKETEGVGLTLGDHEVWNLTWDGGWRMADGFDAPPICVALVDAVNDAFVGGRPVRRDR